MQSNGLLPQVSRWEWGCMRWGRWFWGGGMRGSGGVQREGGLGVTRWRPSCWGSVFVGKLQGWLFWGGNGAVWEVGGGFEVMECGDRAGYKGEGFGVTQWKPSHRGLVFVGELRGRLFPRWEWGYMRGGSGFEVMECGDRQGTRGRGVVVTWHKPSCWGSVFVSDLWGDPNFDWGSARDVVPGFEAAGVRFRCWVCAGVGCTHLVPCTSLLFFTHSLLISSLLLTTPSHLLRPMDGLGDCPMCLHEVVVEWRD